MTTTNDNFEKNEVTQKAFVIYGKVLTCKDGIIEIAGLRDVMAGEVARLSRLLQRLVNYRYCVYSVLLVGPSQKGGANDRIFFDLSVPKMTNTALSDAAHPYWKGILVGSLAIGLVGAIFMFPTWKIAKTAIVAKKAAVVSKKAAVVKSAAVDNATLVFAPPPLSRTNQFSRFTIDYTDMAGQTEQLSPYLRNAQLREILFYKEFFADRFLYSLVDIPYCHILWS